MQEYEMAITYDELEKRLSLLEREVESLRAQLKPRREGQDAAAMADLYGAWAGRLDASEEDFAAVEFSTRWLGAENQG
jgi:hypothetical protein